MWEPLGQGAALSILRKTEETKAHLSVTEKEKKHYILITLTQLDLTGESREPQVILLCT